MNRFWKWPLIIAGIAAVGAGGVRYGYPAARNASVRSYERYNIRDVIKIADNEHNPHHVQLTEDQVLPWFVAGYYNHDGIAEVLARGGTLQEARAIEEEGYGKEVVYDICGVLDARQRREWEKAFGRSCFNRGWIDELATNVGLEDALAKKALIVEYERGKPKDTICSSVLGLAENKVPNAHTEEMYRAAQEIGTSITANNIIVYHHSGKSGKGVPPALMKDFFTAARNAGVELTHEDVAGYATRAMSIPRSIDWQRTQLGDGKWDYIDGGFSSAVAKRLDSHDIDGATAAEYRSSGFTVDESIRLFPVEPETAAYLHSELGYPVSEIVRNYKMHRAFEEMGPVE